MERKAKQIKKHKEKYQPKDIDNCKHSPLNFDCFNNCKRVKVCFQSRLDHKDSGGYVKLPFWLLNKYADKLPPACWAILFYLYAETTWEETKDNYGRCFTPISHLATVFNISQPTVRKYLKVLVDHKIIYHKTTQVRKDVLGKTMFATKQYYSLRWMIEIKKLRKALNKEAV